MSKLKVKKAKIYIYMDGDFEISADNVFISGVYKSVTQFKKLNPGMVPLREYDAEKFLKIQNKQFKELK